MFQFTSTEGAPVAPMLSDVFSAEERSAVRRQTRSKADLTLDQNYAERVNLLFVETRGRTRRTGYVRAEEHARLAWHTICADSRYSRFTVIHVVIKPHHGILPAQSFVIAFCDAESQQ